MKNALILFFVLPYLFFTTNIQKTDFVGKWTGEDNGEIGFIIFDDEGYAAFEVNGQLLGGKDFEMNGEKGEMTYKIDDSKDPIEIDLTMRKFTSKEERTLLCIAKFTDKNNLMFAMGYGDTRPVDFNGDETIELQRVE